MKKDDGQHLMWVKASTFNRLRTIFPEHDYSCTEAVNELIRRAAKYDENQAALEHYKEVAGEVQRIWGLKARELLDNAFSAIYDARYLKETDRTELYALMESVSIAILRHEMALMGRKGGVRYNIIIQEVQQ